MPSWDRPVFENALLGLLHEGPKHGYEICQQFAPGGDWCAVGELPRSQVYALLKALETQDLARATLEEGGRGPARRVYVPTTAGRQRFVEWVRQPAHSIRGLRVEFLLKLYLFERLGLDGLPGLIDAQEAILAERLRAVRAERPRGHVAEWVGELREGLLAAGLEWIRKRRRAAQAR